MSAKHLLGNIWALGGEELSDPHDSAVLCIKSEDGNIATIEQGSGVNHAQLVDNAASIAVDLNTVTTHFASHGHGDHVFGFGQMHERSILHIGQGAIDALAARDHNLDASFLMRGVEPPALDTSRMEPLRDGFQQELGSTLLTAVEMQGHAPGHFGFKLDTPNGTIFYAGDSVFQCGSPIAGTDFDVWRQDLDAVPKQHTFDYVYLGHCNNNLIPDGMDFWRLASKMYLADIRLSHNGLYVDPFGRPDVPAAAARRRPSARKVQEICTLNWAQKVLYDLQQPGLPG